MSREAIDLSEGDQGVTASRELSPTHNAAVPKSSAPAHTPEPWVIVTYGDGDSLVVHSGEHERVCFMATPGDSPGAMERIEAHANLICAAPDLLEAAQLQEAAEDFNANDCRECEGEGVPELCPVCCPRFDDARLARRAAIAKATGVQP